MDFRFTEEQENIRKMVRDFVEKEVAPGAAERDEGESFAPTYELLKKMGKLGLMGLPYPKEYGGAGADQITYALVGFEINRVDASLGCAYSVHISLSGWPIFYYGTEEQRQKYSVPMFKGEKLGAFALTEPNAGSDSGASQCTAVLDGDHYVLNGTKCFCTNAGFADVYVVFAMTDKSKGVKGISAFIVEKDTPGFNFAKQERKMGIRSTVQREIVMENVRVPRENLLGKEGEGFKIAMTTLDGGRIGIAAQGAGIAMGAYEYALKYAKERHQFGKPIAQQQAIAFKLADMFTKIDAAKLLTLYAAHKKDLGLPFSAEAASAKKFATNTAMEVTTEAVQILGGHGFLRDHPVERMMRDAKITQIYEGTNEIQNVVISGIILR
ncbi:MAG: Butyryl-CoA dehydrogenase [Peptococcaceae bacterium]|jgi:alkylation response protein AidB-like acyl-CoA dehydrogenase|uniref:Acyl-CoA dehydrogenase n=1 Tax=Thermanaerosceptrum fracticalcis TaxID=1712410 RepID=A0A7G6E782_THEFR|nr:acyl-CoA dehydrogenase [Thermanaerosceptrum fracticalcis]MBZ4655047.1 Butyryl-CoA dehydrogenase [Peptococcaceae bacterium]QNB47936.1 acyl-CoA dehydrogenase [Thermanaerosceptrum fracticalcis]